MELFFTDTNCKKITITGDFHKTKTRVKPPIKPSYNCLYPSFNTKIKSKIITPAVVIQLQTMSSAMTNYVHNLTCLITEISHNVQGKIVYNI